MRKARALLLAVFLLLLQSADAGDMICTRRACAGKPCEDLPCNETCAGSHERGWGECLRRYPNCCECAWGCG